MVPGSTTAVVIGAGLSGLVAAVQLGRAGIPAVLLDARDDTGGGRTACGGGVGLDACAQRLYERGATVVGLRALGFAVDGVPRGPNGGFAIRQGRKYTLPVGCCSLLTTGLLKLSAKRELSRFLAALPAIDVSALHRVPVRCWLRTQIHDPRVIETVLAMARFATSCDEPDRQSAGAAIDQLKLSLAGPMLNLHSGWTAMATMLRSAAVAAGTIVRMGHPVAAVNTTSGQAAGVTLADGSVLAARAVIVATGPRQASLLLNGAGHARFETTPLRVATLNVALRRLPQTRALFAIGMDEPVSFSVDPVCAPSASDHKAVVRLTTYLRSGTRATRDDEGRLERTLDLLQPGWRDLLVFRRFAPDVVVSQAMVAACAGGLAGRPGGCVAGVENVFLAGDWIGPTGQLADAAVASAMRAARAVERSLASA